MIRGKALCRCTDEWAGIHCDDYRGPSSVCRGQCLHGGVCISTSALSSPRCECLDTWSGPRCEIKASCKYYCFNGGTCSLNPDEDLKPTCMCPPGFYGIRCQTSTNSSSNSSRPAGSSITGTITAIVIVLVVLIIFVAIAVAAVTVMRKRRRGKPFMHVRMQSQENVEISNPMYMREEADEDAETMVPTFVMAGDKAINFANPVYESIYSDSASGSAANEEKKGLLQSETSHPLELPKDHPLAENGDSFS